MFSRHTLPMVPLDKLAQITQRFEFLEANLNAGASPEKIAEISREYSNLKPVADQVAAYRRVLDNLSEAQAMLSDPEMKALAEDEILRLKGLIPDYEDALRLALLPKDAADARPAILEIRPGTGGDEAALFAADLLRMYQRYAERMGWRFDILDQQFSDLGGIKELTAHVQGEGVFARLKFESGVHRVQRVPETEAQGRVHTSAATVAVLPEAEEIDIEIPASDIRIDTMRASGAGGQHVNTTDSAVRISHIPPVSSSLHLRNPSTKIAPMPCRFSVLVFTSWNVNDRRMTAPLTVRRRLVQAIAANVSAPIIFLRVV